MHTRRTVLATTGAVVLAGCSGLTDGGTESATPVGADVPAGSLTLDSPAFKDGATIPTRYTADGADESPPLTIQGVPDEAVSLALVVDDPDAPSGRFVHWLLWNLAPETEEIPAGVPGSNRVDSLGGANQGTNGFGNTGYSGPAPPEADDPHTYVFTLAALDRELDVEPGSQRGRVDEGMTGHVLAAAQLRGTYGR